MPAEEISAANLKNHGPHTGGKTVASIIDATVAWNLRILATERLFHCVRCRFKIPNNDNAPSCHPLSVLYTHDSVGTVPASLSNNALSAFLKPTRTFSA